MRRRGVAYIQEVVCAPLAVGWQGVTAYGLSHLLSPEHAADTKHHLWHHRQTLGLHCLHNNSTNCETYELKQNLASSAALHCLTLTSHRLKPNKPEQEAWPHVTCHVTDVPGHA